VGNGTISISSYYGEALPRAFWAGWNWAFGQGLLLTILLGISALVYAMIRAFRRSHSWQAAGSHISQALLDFLIAGIGAGSIVSIILFAWFFVQDAPKQIAIRDQRIAELGGAPDAPVVISHLTNPDKDRASSAITQLYMFLNTTGLNVTNQLHLNSDPDNIMNGLYLTGPQHTLSADLKKIADQDVYDALYGPNGLMVPRDGLIKSVLEQAIQPKDKKIVEKFSQEVAALYDREVTFHKINEKIGNSDPALTNDLARFVNEQATRVDESDHEMEKVITKTNERISEIREQLQK
jgi:hypothetical protein